MLILESFSLIIRLNIFYMKVLFQRWNVLGYLAAEVAASAWTFSIAVKSFRGTEKDAGFHVQVHRQVPIFLFFELHLR